MTERDGSRSEGAKWSPPLTVAEAAKRIGVSTSTVRREIADGRLRATKIRRLVRVDSEEITRYLAQQQETMPCPSASAGTDVRSELHSVAVAALSALNQLPSSRGRRSKLRSHGVGSKVSAVPEKRKGSHQSSPERGAVQ
ncbi:MAG: helix-turn-helix domain-containing protein [Burkholderiaceae bacterium]|nr:helix-turn-helix domain-containing protein [Burkholderiaceae bacterium]